ncbi:MAG: hypothetical protein PVG53_12610 [Holophagae bacterium]
MRHQTDRNGNGETSSCNDSADRRLALWFGWGDTQTVAEVLDRTPGPRDAAWVEYAFRNACYSGDYRVVAQLASDSPAGIQTPLQRCLAAELTGAAERAELCSQAAARYREARDREPAALWPRLLLARTLSLAGRHDEAESEADAAVAMRNMETDSYGRIEALQVRAMVLARAGRVDAALKIVEPLLSNPSHLSPARLRIDPEWSSLRGNPRVEQIIRSARASSPDHGDPAGDSGRTPRVSEK